jgi:hypothetical protein
MPVNAANASGVAAPGQNHSSWIDETVQAATLRHDCAYPAWNTRFPWRWAVGCLALVFVLMSAPAAHAQDNSSGSLPDDNSAALPKPRTEPAWYMVIDRAGILDDEQERSAINDAWRLTTMGIPTQVVTEFAGLNQEQAHRRAEELRIGHHIESAPGADDGILVYAAVNAQVRSSITIAVSYGRNVVPRNGLTDKSISETFEQVMLSQLKNGRPARAIVYGMRELIYLGQFEPSAIAPLTGWRSTLSDAMWLIAPVAAVVGTGSVLYAMSTTRKRTAWLALGAASLALAGTAVISVLGRSTLGIGVVIGVSALILWQVIALDRAAKPAPRRTLVVTPRRPRRLAALHRGASRP